jgi:Xaa-Pro dipeptidase
MIFEKVDKQELTKRIEKFQIKMQEKGIVASIIYQNVDIYYFTGTMQKSLLVIPSKGEIIFYIQKSIERAKRETPFEFEIHPGEQEIANILKKKGLAKGKVGMELDIIPASIFTNWQKLLDNTDFVNIYPIIRELRMIKSDYEIEQIKKAGTIVDHVFKKAKDIIKEGITELQLSASLEYEGRISGHNGVLRMRGFNQEMDNITVTNGISGTLTSYADAPILGAGLSPAVPHGSSLKRLEKYLPILIDYGACFNGYVTDETRPFVIERLDDFFKRPYETTLKIIYKTIEICREGVNAKDIFNSAYEIVKNANLEDFFMGYKEGKVSFIGHGIGLEINEFPVFTPKHDIILKDGMVFAFEPKFIFPSKGVIGIELDFIVRKDRLERVTNTPFELQIV